MSDKNPARTAPAPRRVQNRDRVEADIAAVAVRVFAECGYEGTSVAAIAEGAGLSKQNLLYYFPTKQALYRRVLDDVLDDWLARMSTLAQAAGDDAAATGSADTAADVPADLLRAYVQAKLRFSREQPYASRVYAMEVIGGAKLYGEQIRERVVPVLKRDIEVFERWIAAGRLAPVNATHLLFAIWAMTQSYADFAAQMALVLDRRQLLKRDFDEAEETIVGLVLAAVRPPQG